jgi:alpha-mannosidase
MPRYTFHLIANAHLDPVWLWDWREGMTEGLTTVRTILDLMDERPEMTFIRGEAAIYRHIEERDPETFARIRKQVAAGRWDVVGGTHIQPDTNLPATETLARQFTSAQAYFRSRFGTAPKIAWAADSFGHSAGLPEILAQAGMTGFAFTRPEKKELTLENPAFWWEGSGGSRILSYRPTAGWYGSNRDEIPRRLDAYLEAAAEFPMRIVGCYYGVGNHGGGPTRRQLDDIARWAAQHPEVEVVHSGLHRFFAALASEERHFPGGRYPTHQGELNFCLRGCYASLARFKFPYRRAEAELTRAEATDAMVAAKLDRKPANLATAWESVLFNSFHDILPGSSIERAYDDQLSWLGVARHTAQRAEFDALDALAARVDTSVPRPCNDQPSRVPFLVWNPHPHVYEGPIELETPLDYRPVAAYKNKPDQVPVELIGPRGDRIPFQTIETEHAFFLQDAWRKRIVFRAKLPPAGWSVFQIGLAEKMRPVRVALAASARSPGTIRNGAYRITAAKGDKSLQIFHRGRPLFQGDGLSVLSVDDPWGSWGSIFEEKASLDLSTVRETWKIAGVELLERGPERASLWVRFAGARSRLDLTFSLARERPVVDVRARVFWNERSRRLKLAFPVGEHARARFEVPGGIADRGPAGEVPGGRWVGVGPRFGFASDALYGFDLKDGVLRATVVRASLYSADVATVPGAKSRRPATDAGELTFRFLLTHDPAQLPRLARELEQPLVVQMATPHPGTLPRSGSLFALEPDHVQLTALKPADDGRGWIVRLQETAGHAAQARGNWLGHRVDFGLVGAWGLQTFRMTPRRRGWKVAPTNIQER